MVLSKLVIWLLVFFPKISKGSEGNLFQYSDLKYIVCTSKDGCFKGKLEDNGGHTAWYGIPYAAPPVDQLRFQAPANPSPISDLWNSTYHRSQCIHVNLLDNSITGSEDCLYLNVYQPQFYPNETLRILPVMVFLHGDSFSDDLCGPEILLREHRMIVVTIQYRLGVFGFLASGDKHCPGNFGLKDQSKALKWVKRNILHFGGDPNKITLMGEGAGSISAQLQMMSVSSNDLFERSILISQSANAPFAIDQSPKKVFKEFLNKTGIKTSTDTVAVMDELRDLTSDQLIAAFRKMENGLPMIPLFRPVIEGQWSDSFINEDPRFIWSSGAYQHRSIFYILNGYEEGIFADIYENETVRQTILKDFSGSMAELLELSPVSLGPIREYYFDNNPNDMNIYNISQVLRDFIYYSPVLEDIRDATSTSSEAVHLLLFNFTSDFSLSSRMHQFSHTERGPSQSDVLLYLFNATCHGQFPKEQPELQASNLLVDLITQFLETDLEGCTLCQSSKILDGFCSLEMQRNYDIAMLRESNSFDMHSMAVMRSVRELKTGTTVNG